MSDDVSILIGEDLRPFEIEIHDPAEVGAACCKLFLFSEPGEMTRGIEGAATVPSLVRGEHGSFAFLTGYTDLAGLVTPLEAIVGALKACSDEPASDDVAKKAAASALAEPSIAEDLLVTGKALEALTEADVEGEITWPSMADLQILVERAVTLAFDYVAESR